MTPIRPPLAPPLPSAARTAADPARLAAQKAFFSIAAGQAPSPAAPVQAQPPAGAARPAQRAVAAPAEAPGRLLRPGSLLDIRV